jgi:hypothetical protein
MEPQSTQSTQSTQIESTVNRLSERIIGCALTVQCTLGVGLLYENALAHELRKAGLASRNNMEWPFGMAASRLANMPRTCWPSTRSWWS